MTFCFVFFFKQKTAYEMRISDWSSDVCSSDLNTGGTIMGTSPRDSVVNPFLQSWDVHNVFVMGAGAFPQNPGYNPTGTVGALTYWAADAIRNRYLKAPGPLVQA